MQNENQDLNRLYQKVQSGTSSSGERKWLAKWLAGVDLQAEALTDQQIGHQRQKLKYRFNKQFENQKRKSTIHKLRWLPRAAAILALTISLGWLLFSPPASKKQAVTLHTVTQTSSRKTITLTDGSIITLNSLSELKYPEHFDGNTREVFLAGEAFFNIKHDAKKPFIVHAGKLAVQVLGTSFNINSYTDSLTQVTVASGKVGVLMPNYPQASMLLPGEQLSYAQGTFVQHDVDAEDFSNWQKGTLTFKNERLDVICKRLERWYGVKISILTPALANKKLSLKQHNESLNTVLKLLGVAGGFKYSLTEQIVKIW